MENGNGSGNGWADPAIRAKRTAAIRAAQAAKGGRQPEPVATKTAGALALAECPAQWQFIPRYTVSLVRESGIKIEDYPRFANSRDIWERFRALFLQFDREHFCVVTLDSKNRLIGLHDISSGSLSSSVVHPREVLKSAILNNSAAIIAMHGHPSGDPTPSREDRECTARLFKACEIMGIRLLDHIVFGESEFFSFADAGQLNVNN
jgi:DNA repair protein RadC